MKKLILSLLFFTFILATSPQLIYWWGLSKIDGLPVPSKVKQSEERELEIWLTNHNTGTPTSKPISPYGYAALFYCVGNNAVEDEICFQNYPSLKISNLVAREHVYNKLADRSSFNWHLSCVAYTIWITKNWDIHQILSAYDEINNKSRASFTF
ncbi:hypothetical protein Q4519_02450 [Motilimonas sp. 1_MG-2023]|uniref:hypothetical protein n=1 Tax=Motilimonas sp. 1_MG-2023 TaxID=3062672 RepID=UPI0026E38159|nr:hypothetical protein [Motilimonas sp. 1_MG-2023]MDO6524534.1 hypothetical protein [Motilimonas sp. 1_MG-2023]